MKKLLITLMVMLSLNGGFANTEITTKLIDQSWYQRHYDFIRIVDKYKNTNNNDIIREYGRLFLKMVVGAKSNGTRDQMEYLLNLPVSKYFINRLTKGKFSGYNALHLTVLKDDPISAQILLDANCNYLFKNLNDDKSFLDMIKNKGGAWSAIYKKYSKISNKPFGNNSSLNKAANDVIDSFQNVTETLYHGTNIAEELKKYRPDNI
ncbi:MAG: hypothetical protein HRT87_02685 [Legionellales bacterium]|nr:hypothetical protein [Legionellales bacterium]